MNVQISRREIADYQRGVEIDLADHAWGGAPVKLRAAHEEGIPRRRAPRVPGLVCWITNRSVSAVGPLPLAPSGRLRSDRRSPGIWIETTGPLALGSRCYPVEVAVWESA